MKKSLSLTALSLTALLMTVVFINLKLFGVITWSWIWVTSPYWIVVLIYRLIHLIVYIQLKF